MAITEKPFQLSSCDINRKKLSRFFDAILGKPVPKFLRLVKLDQGVRKIFRLVCNENVFVISQRHALYREGGCDNWDTEAHALVDFTFYPRTPAQRCNG